MRHYPSVYSSEIDPHADDLATDEESPEVCDSCNGTGIICVSWNGDPDRCTDEPCDECEAGQRFASELERREQADAAAYDREIDRQIDESR